MNNTYEYDKYIEKIIRGDSTDFIDLRIQMYLKNKLKKNTYNIYYPYNDSEKVIFYVDSIPIINLYEIKTNIKLSHQDIMGTLYSIGINPSMYGDILIINDHYYIYILNRYENYFLSNLTTIKNTKVILSKCDNNLLINYKREYDNIEFVTSSLRIDNIVSHICHTNRDSALKKIKGKEVLVNYDYPKNSYSLKENDVFSIRKFGKYKFIKITNQTKKGKFIIEIYKYK